MSFSNNKNNQAQDSKKELHQANEKRINDLLNISDKYVRTKRHLEQHSDISDPDNLQHAEEIQKHREEQMENLKNIIAYGKHEEVDEKENVERNYIYTQ